MAFSILYVLNIKNSMKKTLIIALCVVVFGLVSFKTITNVIAEQGGFSPDSGATSRIGTLSGLLTTSGYGSDTNTPNWGSMWNRIYTSAMWTPSDTTATVADVASGKTFYAGNNRTKITGTLVAAPAIDYSLQKNATKDNYLGTYTAEEASWSDVGTYALGSTGLSSGLVRLDGRTGLKWSASSTATNITNSFTLSADGARPTGGNAIAFCNGLNSASFGGKTNWYLPTQAELMQAYIDGIYSQNTSFGTTNYFWSSSEVSDYSAYAWRVYLYSGYTRDVNKTSDGAVRCVSRD
jgi:hypothetical protein